MRAGSRDTVRSRALTGKPARQLRTAWTEAWDGKSSPGTLPMPLQFMLTAEALTRIGRAAEREGAPARELVGTAVWQIVSRMNEVRSAADVIRSLVEEYVEVVGKLEGTLQAAQAGRAAGVAKEGNQQQGESAAAAV